MWQSWEAWGLGWKKPCPNSSKTRNIRERHVEGKLGRGFHTLRERETEGHTASIRERHTESHRNQDKHNCTPERFNSKMERIKP